MSNVFPYRFDDAQSSFHGTFSIKKINKEYHYNYDYFKIHFLEGKFLLKDAHQNKMYEENVTGIKAAIALKKEYLQEMPPARQKSLNFTNSIELGENKYNLMVVNTDLENKLTNNLILKGMLHRKIKDLFIGNEKYLLTIK
ncbi:hypothetical protein B7C51_09905 [Paenibacillus larvae subsp. pulvifaciens]|uniref:Orfx1 TULIPs domain-containing protein n=1 Tax=Paenibacillus larvae subsp. pulvifaciens TaxID=1477 RepID=A0A1V0USM6_9BACL|nr:hypothetical protein [Paenibacillus larvae]ARF68076.1 hypothetical protein B7C51_09905 [Paenibacillus larvae subsp. pulvifaciens]